MIATTAYILISTIIAHGSISQTTATFADKASCESAVQRQDFVIRAFETHFTKWNLTCHPYTLNGESK